MSGTNNSSNTPAPSYFGKAMQSVVGSLTGNTNEHDTKTCGNTMDIKTCKTVQSGMDCAGSACESKDMKMECGMKSKDDSGKNEMLQMGVGSVHVDTKDKIMDNSMECMETKGMECVGKAMGSDHKMSGSVGKSLDGANEKMCGDKMCHDKMSDHMGGKMDGSKVFKMDDSKVCKTDDSKVCKTDDSKMCKTDDSKMCKMCEKMDGNKMCKMCHEKMSGNKMGDKMCTDKMCADKKCDQKMSDSKMSDNKMGDQKVGHYMEVTDGKAKEMMEHSGKDTTASNMPVTGGMCKLDC